MIITATSGSVQSNALALTITNPPVATITVNAPSSLTRSPADSAGAGRCARCRRSCFAGGRIHLVVERHARRRRIVDRTHHGGAGRDCRHHGGVRHHNLRAVHSHGHGSAVTHASHQVGSSHRQRNALVRPRRGSHPATQRPSLLRTCLARVAISRTSGPGSLQRATGCCADDQERTHSRTLSFPAANSSRHAL